MPFKSKAQAKYMFAKHPKIAKEFAAKTPSIKALPAKTSTKSTPAQKSTVAPKKIPNVKSPKLPKISPKKK